MGDASEPDKPRPIEFVVSLFSSRRWVHGSLVTYDGEAKAGYLTVCPDPEHDLSVGGCCHRAGGTVDVGDGVFLDCDSDGHVIGVEVLGREVGLGDLILALRWAQLW